MKQLPDIHAQIEGEAAQCIGYAASVANRKVPSRGWLEFHPGVEPVLAGQSVAAGGGGALKHVLATGLSGRAFRHHGNYNDGKAPFSSVHARECDSKSAMP